MLYIVSTPIGNLEDITLRAIKTLEKADVILCEDTRHSLILLDRYNIKKKLLSYHKFNEAERLDEIIALLKEDKDVALITDAGTPLISDPGSELIKRAKKEGLSYTAIPGASAVINALVLSGMDLSSFTFLGFIPKDRGRKEFLEKLKDVYGRLVFYVPPHAVNTDFADLYKVFGNAKFTLVNEMTKMYEKVIDGELSSELSLDLKGEIVLIVDRGEKHAEDVLSLTPAEHLTLYLKRGMEKNEAIKLVAKERKVPKNEIYRLLID